MYEKLLDVKFKNVQEDGPSAIVFWPDFIFRFVPLEFSNRCLVMNGPLVSYSCTEFRG